MSRERWRIVSGIVATVGGLSWLAKLTVIVATGGEVVDTGAAAAFYLLGVGLLVLAGALVGLWLTSDRGILARVAGAALGAVGFLGSFVILDSIGQAIVGERGPDYASAEAGILLTALMWLVIGLWILRTSTRAPELAPAGQQ